MVDVLVKVIVSHDACISQFNQVSGDRLRHLVLPIGRVDHGTTQLRNELFVTAARASDGAGNRQSPMKRMGRMKCTVVRPAADSPIPGFICRIAQQRSRAFDKLLGGAAHTHAPLILTAKAMGSIPSSLFSSSITSWSMPRAGSNASGTRSL